MALKERSGRLLASVRGWSPLRIIGVTLRSQSEHLGRLNNEKRMQMRENIYRRA